MNRRRWLKLGIGATAVLALGGGALAWARPGLQDGRLTTVGREVMRPLVRVLLDGSLPSGPAQSAALDAFLHRVDILVEGLPSHAQGELSQLLSLLASRPGRVALTGLGPAWAHATLPQIQHALQSMRMSRFELPQQAYHALHDISGGAYFSDSGTWDMLGYPGPQAV